MHCRCIAYDPCKEPFFLLKKFNFAHLNINKKNTVCENIYYCTITANLIEGHGQIYVTLLVQLYDLVAPPVSILRTLMKKKVYRSGEIL